MNTRKKEEEDKEEDKEDDKEDDKEEEEKEEREDSCNEEDSKSGTLEKIPSINSNRYGEGCRKECMVGCGEG